MPVTPRNDDEETKVLIITTPPAKEKRHAPSMRELEATHATLTFMKQPDALHDEVRALCKNGCGSNGHEAEEAKADAERIAALTRRIKGGSKLRLRKKRKV